MVYHDVIKEDDVTLSLENKNFFILSMPICSSSTPERVDEIIEMMARRYYYNIDIVANREMSKKPLYLLEMNFIKKNASAKIRIIIQDDKYSVKINNRDKLLCHIMVKSALNRLAFVGEAFHDRISGRKMLNSVSLRKSKKNIFSNSKEGIELGFLDFGNYNG